MSARQLENVLGGVNGSRDEQTKLGPGKIPPLLEGF